MRLQSLAGGSGCFAEHSGFLVDGEAARGGLLHKPCGDLGQRLFERGAVEAAAGDGFPGDLERASEKRVVVAHGLFDPILTENTKIAGIHNSGTCCFCAEERGQSQ